MSITLPSGPCRLGVQVTLDAGELTPMKDRSVILLFVHHGTTDSAMNAKFVAGDNGEPDYHRTLTPDNTGLMYFDLNLPDNLTDALDIYIKLNDEPRYTRGTNEWMLSLTEHITDHTSEVDKLEIVSGTPQWTQLPDRKPYADLVVKATHGGAPVGSARVTWAVTDDPGKTKTTVPSGPVFTSGGGLARITPVAGTNKGQLTITATCNGHSVDFHLVVLPARGDLMLVSPVLPAIISAKATTPVTVKVRLVSKSDQSEFWPGIPCRFIHTQNPINGLVAENTPAPDARITSDQRGDLPPFNVHFSSLGRGVHRGSIDYLAYLPGDDTTPASATISLSVR
ncbi:hypothetical protein [Cedecea sp. NFIX57]|uniref:hypothetical protein n=1 Tax=Cedecea sp. NFIX57 TaxID=1566286 RepID=UPI000A0DEE9B|nr:hypothetical protein [Cedecea sp. NFIX57]SMG61127.1 hypothetical protein SAMN03159353_104312 [Cedecea sp. NFIX57]